MSSGPSAGQEVLVEVLVAVNLLIFQGWLLGSTRWMGQTLEVSCWTGDICTRKYPLKVSISHAEWRCQVASAARSSGGSPSAKHVCCEIWANPLLSQQPDTHQARSNTALQSVLLSIQYRQLWSRTPSTLAMCMDKVYPCINCIQLGSYTMLQLQGLFSCSAHLPLQCMQTIAMLTAPRHFAFILCLS